MTTVSSPGPHDDITDVPGIEVGHWTHAGAATGCTVVLARSGAVAGVDVRGGAPGTRETDLLDPATSAERVYAVVLSGGSAFGLDAASGVMRWLAERGIGRPGPVTIPIVVSAILYDLGLGRSDRRPDSQSGYAAAMVAGSYPVEQGSVGAGTGATVGKLLGPERATKGGLGSASERLVSGATVGALVAVNAVGEVVDPTTGNTIAGPRGETVGGFETSVAVLREGRAWTPPTENTTLVCVATDAALTKAQTRRVAIAAHAGIARTVRPAYLPMDGDVLFALSTATDGAAPLDLRGLAEVCALAAYAVERATVKAVRVATGLHGIPSAGEWLAEV